MKVLVIDDQKINLFVVEKILKDVFDSIEVVLCDEPLQGIHLIESEEFDILMLDIIMPDISGIDILKKIRANKKYDDMQILMLTGLTDSKSIQTCFEIGVNDYIKKPIEKTEFESRIKAAHKSRMNTLMVKELLAKMQEKNEELEALNVTLQETQYHLVQSEKMMAIGELAAGIAHEINNPMGYVSSNIEILATYLHRIKQHILYTHEKMGILANELKDNSLMVHLEAIQESYEKLKISLIINDFENIVSDSNEGVKKVTEIVKSLRNFARKGLEEEKEYCLAEEIISQAMIIVRNEAKYVVKIFYEPTHCQSVFCNRGQIGQVVLNIIMNAIQAIKQQKRKELGQIQIKEFIDSQFYCISIKDDGPGISKENLNKIFNPFFTTKEVGYGTGLGLSISYDIVVKKHNGILDVKSEEGKGTEFLIKLPLKKESEDVE